MTQALAGSWNTSTGAPDLLQVARVHHGNAIGDLERVFAVVGHEHRGHPRLRLQAAQPGAQLLADAGVEGAERLVEQEHPRLCGQRAGECHPLPLPSGELRRQPRREPIETHVRQELSDAVDDARLGSSPHAETERDVLEDGHVLEERVVLEHEPDVARGCGRIASRRPRRRAPCRRRPSRARRGCAGASSCRSPKDRAARPVRPRRRSTTRRRARCSSRSAC